MAQIIGFVIHKLKYCGRRRKYWFQAILNNSTLTLKAFLGSLTFLKDCIVNVFKHPFFFFYGPTSKDPGYIVLPSSVCLSAQT